MLISILIPCYNEEEVLQETLNRICQLIDKQEQDFEVLCINDGSSDNTWNILQDFAKKDGRIKALSLSRNWGHQSALSAGIHQCRGEAAIAIDADLQDPPELIPDMIEIWQKEKAHVVYGVRKKRKGEGIFKRLTAKMYYRFMNYLTDQPFPVDTGDFRLMDRKVIDCFKAMPERNKYIRGLISWMGFKQVPIEYIREPRWAGETKYPLKKMLKLAFAGIFSFSLKPLRLAIKLGSLTLLVALVLTGYVLYKHFSGSPDLVPGWASTILAIVFFSGVQLLSLGILGEYLGSLFSEAKQRPDFIIDQSLNMDK